MKKFTYLITLLLLLLSACGSGGNDPQPNQGQDQNDQTTSQKDPAPPVEIIFDLGSPEANECIAPLSLDFLNLENISNNDDPAGLIEDTFPADETYCAEEITQETQDTLNEFDRLIDEGSTDQALQLIADYVNKLEAELLSMGATPHLASINPIHDGGRTRIYMKQMFTIATRLQQKGLDDEAQEYIQKAIDAFEKYGYEELGLIEDNFRAALAIAGEAQLLGLFDLGDTAIEKASEIVERLLNEALDAFTPCDSNKAEVENIKTLLAYGQALGVPNAEFLGDEFYFDQLPEWEEVQEKRKKGEQVEGCDLNAIKINQDIGGLYVYSGEAYSCDGTNWTVDVTISGNIEGLIITGEGETTQFTVTDGKGETIIPTNGSITGDGKTGTFEAPLIFGITLSEDGQTAEFGIGSNTPNGSMTITDGKRTITTIFALPGGFFTVPMTTHACDN